MRFLLLNGFGIGISVDNAKLIIQDGRKSVEGGPSKYIFKPKTCDFDNIVVYGHTGFITFEAMKWLMKQNIQLTLLNWNGKLLTTILPPEAKQTKLKFAQYRAYEDRKRISLARKLIEGKLRGSKAVLSWLKERYPQIDDDIEKEADKLDEAKTVSEIMNVEGRVAGIYWKELSKIFEKKFEFEGRLFGKTRRPMGAVDPINALFNFGYAMLESQCFKALNSVGLDTHVGFLHEVIPGKAPLVYDLQEPFRWIIDVAIINGLEKGIFNKKDFIRTENYNIKLRPSGAKKLVKEVETQLNKTINYLGRQHSWSFTITLKAQELAHYLLDKRKDIDFSLPIIKLERKDDHELREKILKLSYSEAKKLGIGKSSLWYMKHNAMSNRPFKIYNKIKERL